MKYQLDIIRQNIQAVPTAVKIYIARDEETYDYSEDPDEPQKIPGELHIFYDTPELRLDPRSGIWTWTNARKICTIPSYMYPMVRERQMLVLSGTITPRIF